MSESSAADDLDHAPAHSIAAVLRIREFRNLWLGLGLSSLGDWIGLLAITAMANERAGQLSGLLGGSQYQLQNYAIAGVLFLRVLPALLMGPIAGYVADRLDRRWTLIVGDYLRAALFLSMPLVGSLWWVFAATVLIEAVSLVWGPAKDATVPNLVPPHRLEAANQVSLATTYGSALPAALLYVVLTLVTKTVHYTVGWWGNSPIELALYFNALSFLVSGIVISRMRTIPRGAAASGDQHDVSPWRTIVDGWRFVMGTPLVRGLVVGIVGAFTAGGLVVALARTFVDDLGGGEPGYGLLFACVFAGLALGMWRGPRLLQGLSRRRLFGVMLTGAGLILIPIALVQHLEIVVWLTVLLGFCSGVAWITGNTMLGLEVPDEWRGRTFAFVGSMIRLALSVVLAVGPLAAGLIGQHTINVPNTRSDLVYNGAAWTFLVAGLVMTAVGVTSYRQMDDRKGIPLLSDLRSAITQHPGVYSASGLFVAFEGGEGAGKSTQATLLRTWLEEQGHEVLLTHEPGDTEVGRKLRDIVLDPATGTISDRTEALLYAADKAEHIETVVVPALQRGAVVITDRYVDSMIAYQGAGRAIPVPEIERVVRWATADLRPDLTVLLDLAPDAGLTRFEERDRIEGESIEFHERVREGFLRLATAKPERYLVVDAHQPPETIAGLVRGRLLPLLAPPAPTGTVQVHGPAAAVDTSEVARDLAVEAGRPTPTGRPGTPGSDS